LQILYCKRQSIPPFTEEKQDNDTYDDDETSPKPFASVSREFIS